MVDILCNDIVCCCAATCLKVRHGWLCFFNRTSIYHACPFCLRTTAGFLHDIHFCFPVHIITAGAGNLKPFGTHICIGNAPDQAPVCLQVFTTNLFCRHKLVVILLISLFTSLVGGIVCVERLIIGNFFFCIIFGSRFRICYPLDTFYDFRIEQARSGCPVCIFKHNLYMVFIRCKNLIEKFLGFLVFPRGQLHIQVVLDSCCVCFPRHTVRLEGILDIFSILGRFLAVDILAVNGKVKTDIRIIRIVSERPVISIHSISAVLPCEVTGISFTRVDTIARRYHPEQFRGCQLIVNTRIHWSVFTGHAVISRSCTHNDHAAVPSLSVACDGLCVFYSMGKSVVVRPVSRIFIGTFSDNTLFCGNFLIVCLIVLARTVVRRAEAYKALV